MTKKKEPPVGDTDTELLARLRSTTELLERIIADRGVLVGIPAEERKRLLHAVGAGLPSRRERAPPNGARHDAPS